jgi:hypothetical protein
MLAFPDQRTHFVKSHGDILCMQYVTIGAEAGKTMANPIAENNE